MNNQGTLPPLPASDKGSFDTNSYDGFYKVKARSFWGDNEIHRIPDTPPVACKHDFQSVPEGVRCKKCHVGLLGSIEVRNNKLFHNNEPIGL